MNKEIRIFEMFAGIGSQYLALKNVFSDKNWTVRSLGACDFYIDAIISYMIIHYGTLKPETKITKDKMIQILSEYTLSADSKNVISKKYFSSMDENRLQKIFPYLYAYINNDYFTDKYNIEERERERESGFDILKYSRLPKNIDILTYSFPCQDLSQQGKQKGLKNNTRSGLLYQIERILKENKDRLPKILLLENVKSLSTKKFINDFEKWIKTLKNLGYHSKWKVLNSVDYGSCQNRERVFMLSVLESENLEINFPPEKIIHKNKLKNIIKDPFDGQSAEKLLNEYKYEPFKETKSKITKSKLINYTNFNSETYIYEPLIFGPTLTASGANSRLKFYFKKENHLRYINEIETYQYMGFPKEIAKKVKKTGLIKPTKMIFTCGNSISVEVLEAIFKEIKNAYIK